MEILKRPPSTLKNVNGGSPGGANGDSRAPTINAEKRRQWAPGGANVDPGVPTINSEKHRQWAPGRY
jgi:hypothetical protein